MGILDWLFNKDNSGRQNRDEIADIVRRTNRSLAPLNEMQSRGIGWGSRGGGGSFGAPVSNNRPVGSAPISLKGLGINASPKPPSGPGPGIAARPGMLDPFQNQLNAFMAQFQGGSMLDPGLAAQMAAEEYNPQLDALAATLANARQREEEGRKYVGNAYGALVNSIKDDAGDISGIHDTAKKEIVGGYDSAKSSIAQNYDESAAGMEAMMRRLGLQEAAPDALAHGAEGRAQQTSLMDQYKSTNSTAQDKLKVNALDYNTQTAQTAGLAGSNAQADLTRQLNDVLAQGEIAKLGLLGQKAQRENDLFFQINNTNFDRQQSAASFLQELMNAQAQASQASGPNGPSAKQEFDMMDPWSQVSTQVMNRTGNPDKTKAIMDFVRDQISMGDLTAPDALGRTKTPAQIATAIRANNRAGSGIPSHEIDAIVAALAAAGYFG